MEKHYPLQTERPKIPGRFVQFSVCFALMLVLCQAGFSQTTVVLAGDYQHQIGCPDDWAPDCSLTALTESSPGTWEGTFFVPAGFWSFKVAHDNTWDINYGAYGVQNGDAILLYVEFDRHVHFSYSTTSHLVDISFPAIVSLAGSFQTEIGCPGDWQLGCSTSALKFDPNANRWFGSFYLPAGDYEYKSILNEHWEENYGVGGVLDGASIPLTLATDAWIFFQYNPDSHVTTHWVVNSMVFAAGDFHSELGCWGDWQPDCPYTALKLDGNGNWRGTFKLPAGNYEFKITIDGGWGENYGAGGELNGPNMSVEVSSPAKVTFIYDPLTHLTEYFVEPEIVVLPGTFQSLLGCSGDWQPACHNTQLFWDNEIGRYTGTFNLPAGYYEYKVAINNSWRENYGDYGSYYGSNIPLNLASDQQLTFQYDPYSHLVTVIYQYTKLCVNTYYDANANNYNDDYIVMPGIQVNLGGDTTAAMVSDSTGQACFTDIPSGAYSVSVVLPDGFLATGPESMSLTVTGPSNIGFGMVCVGAANAKGVGFWMSKNGTTAFNSLWSPEYFLYSLNWSYLRNADGSQFVPASYDELKVWMNRGTATNIAYSLSVQLAAYQLNLESGMVGYDRIVHTPGIGYDWYNPNFMPAYYLVWKATEMLAYYPVVTGGSPQRTEMENLKNILERANSNLSWVQQQPCNSVQAAAQEVDKVIPEISLATTVDVYPNPSDGAFNLRFVWPSDEEQVDIQVRDMNGMQVFRTTVTANKDLQFGNSFRPGLYFIEITGKNIHEHVKVVKK
jgi:hypothetical protein